MPTTLTTECAMVCLSGTSFFRVSGVGVSLRMKQHCRRERRVHRGRWAEWGPHTDPGRHHGDANSVGQCVALARARGLLSSVVRLPSPPHAAPTDRLVCELKTCTGILTSDRFLVVTGSVLTAPATATISNADIVGTSSLSVSLCGRIVCASQACGQLVCVGGGCFGLSFVATSVHWTSNQVGPWPGSRSEPCEFTHVQFDLVVPCTGVLLGWYQHLEWLHNDKHRHLCSGRRAGVLGVCLRCVGHSVGLGRVLWERGAVHRLAQGNPCFRLSRLASHLPPPTRPPNPGPSPTLSHSRCHNHHHVCVAHIPCLPSRCCYSCWWCRGEHRPFCRDQCSHGRGRACVLGGGGLLLHPRGHGEHAGRACLWRRHRWQAERRVRGWLRINVRVRDVVCPAALCPCSFASHFVPAAQT